MEETKVCSKCKIEKSILLFDKDKTRITGISYICKECKSNNERKRRGNPEYNISQREYRKNNQESVKYSLIKSRAKIDDIEFSIDKSDIVIPDICPILGIPLFYSNGSNSHNSPSLDRIDNAKGYVKGNVCVISRRANAIKNNGTLEEHEKVIEYMRGRYNQVDYYSLDDTKRIRQVLVTSARKRSREKNLFIDISKMDVIIPIKCPVLDIALTFHNKVICDTSPSVDRFDNSIGYTPENVKVISWRANRIKGFGSIEEHEKIVEYMRKYGA